MEFGLFPLTGYIALASVNNYTLLNKSIVKLVLIYNQAPWFWCKAKSKIGKERTTF